MFIGIARAFSGPAFSALAPNLVPRESLPTAIAVSATAWQLGTIAGPSLGGVLYAIHPDFAYATIAGLLVAATLAVFLVGKVPQPPVQKDRRPIHRVIDGFNYVRNNRLVMAAITLDLFVVLLAGATAFRRDAFVKAGGYHPRYFLGGEEALLALDLYRAGAWLVYAPHLTVHHYPSKQRDVHARASVSTRNAVWTAWLRWPASAALAHTLRMLPRLWRERGVTPALAGLPWILRERQAIPPEVERMRRRVDDAERRRTRARA